MKLIKTILLSIIFSLFFSVAYAQTTPYQYDWPTLAHDMKRSGSTAVGPDGPYTKVWYRDLWSEFGEQVVNSYQPVIVRDQAPGHNNIDLTYIGTIHGSIYAFNANTGETYWRYPATGFVGSIISTPTVEGAIVYVGDLDGKVYALDGTNVAAGTVSPKWVFDSGRQGGFFNTPVVTADSVYIGGRDGYFYALDKSNGNKRWEVNIGSPILTSAAYENGVVYFAAENMRAYAYNTSGTRVWESAQMSGQTLRYGYPVITNNNVIFRTALNDSPNYMLPEEEQLLAFAAGCLDYPHVDGIYDRQRDVYPDWWPDVSLRGQLRIPCFRWKSAASSQADYDRETQAVRDYLSGKGYTASDGQTVLGRPQYESFFVLNKSNGQKPYVAPVLWTAGNNSPGIPPVVGPDGRLWALYRTYYSDYDEPSFFIMNAFGQMDEATGNITLRNPNPNPTGYACSQDSCNPPFGTNVWMIADETTSFSIAGNKIFSNQWAGLGTVDLRDGTIQSIIGQRDGFATALIGNNPRSLFFGTAPEMGANDTSFGPSIFGDKLFINYGSIIAMVQGHLPGTIPTPIPTMTPYPIKPFTATTANTVTMPVQAELEHYIWEVPQAGNIDNKSSDLRANLEAEVTSFLDTGRLAPWFFIPGKSVINSYFLTSADTAYYLSLAYPYVLPTLQARIRAYVADDWTTTPPADRNYGTNGSRYPWYEGLTYSNGVVADSGSKQRLDYPMGPMVYCAIRGGCEGSVGGGDNYFFAPASFDRLYEMWLYAYRSGDWGWIETNWNNIKTFRSKQYGWFDLLIDPANDDSLLGLNTNSTNSTNRTTNDSANRRLSSIIAYARMAQHMSDAAEVTWATNAATAGMQARLRYVNNFRPTDGDGRNVSTNTWWVDSQSQSGGGFIQRFGAMNTNIPHLRDMTPEVGRLLSDYASQDTNRYSQFFDVARPLAYLQRGLTTFAGEILYVAPENMQGIFNLKALTNKQSGDDLRRYLDIPWVKQDYFYWERLARTIEAYGTTSWCDVRSGACTISSQRGDVNQDTQVNVLDIQACVNHILGIQDLGSRGDVNGDSSVNVLDVQNIVNIILGV